MGMYGVCGGVGPSHTPPSSTAPEEHVPPAQFPTTRHSPLPVTCPASPPPCTQLPGPWALLATAGRAPLAAHSFSESWRLHRAGAAQPAGAYLQARLGWLHASTQGSWQCRQEPYAGPRIHWSHMPLPAVPRQECSEGPLPAAAVTMAEAVHHRVWGPPLTHKPHTHSRDPPPAGRSSPSPHQLHHGKLHDIM